MDSVQRKMPGGPKAMLLAIGIAGLLFALAPRAFAAGRRLQNVSPQPPRVTAKFAIADFDGDLTPDYADVEPGQGDSQSTLYWIAFRLSRGSSSVFGISAPPGGLRIASADVNDDGFPDVLVSTFWTKQPVAVLLNDGRGDFRVSYPSEFLEALASAEFCWTAQPSGINVSQFAILTFGQDQAASGDTNRATPRNTTLASVDWNLGDPSWYCVHRLPGRSPPSDSLRA